MSDKEIVPIQRNEPFALMPVMDIESAIDRRNAIVEFVAGIMEEDRDFGKIPGTTKPTLLKPGAEKLTTFFGLSPRFSIEEKDLDWTGEHHGHEPFFYFQYKCQLWRGDLLAGEGLGSCNSWEKKYRYRLESKGCPKCGGDFIIKGKEEYGGGWLCFAKKGGCGQKWPDGAVEIEDQKTGMILNDNPSDLVNTIDKMSQKRALVAATLIAVNASEFFTQDMEDIVDGIHRAAEEKVEKKEDVKKQKPDAKGKTVIRVKNQWEDDVIKTILDLGLAKAREHVVNRLNPSIFMTTVSYEELTEMDAVAYMLAWDDAQAKHPDEETKERAARVDNNYLEFTGKAIELLSVGEE